MELNDRWFVYYDNALVCAEQEPMQASFEL
jgi:hypothetical protein